MAAPSKLRQQNSEGKFVGKQGEWDCLTTVAPDWLKADRREPRDSVAERSVVTYPPCRQERRRAKRQDGRQ
ncbi:MAG: hypothetical protein WCX97_00275 [Candidatus Magasanikbacteria bacterium]